MISHVGRRTFLPLVISMSSQSRVVRRNCAFCAKAENRKQMIPVTKNKEQLLVWNQRLGAEFQENCEKTITPYLCLSHFPRKKAEFPRSKISPYLVSTLYFILIRFFPFRMENLLIWREMVIMLLQLIPQFLCLHLCLLNL